ncbi:MAG: aldo/keto reductase [Cyanobacteria bacterium SZAS TMP-1]|nr:aldo/keto reductase [Cyanobacteria bacterium SZAS TMP-1]
MDYRNLGASNVKASVITYGAWAIGGTMWGGSDEADAIEAIHASIDAGVTSIDTAPIYGYGKSEELVARAIAGKRDQVQIFTKFGLRWDDSEGEYFFELNEGGKTTKIYRNARKKSVIAECEQSLKRLKTDHIDLYQCHWRDHTTELSETMEALAQLLKEGKILAAGVSNFTAEEIETSNKIVPIASDQPPYSMVLRDIEKDVLPFCIKNNIGVIVYSPLQRGLLTGKFKPDHKFSEGDHRASQPHFQPAYIKRVNEFLQNLKPYADKQNATTGNLVLAWTIHQPGITAALVGARDAAQASENARAADIKLTAAELAEIGKLVESLSLTPSTT